MWKRGAQPQKAGIPPLCRNGNFITPMDKSDLHDIVTNPSRLSFFEIFLTQNRLPAHRMFLFI
ncbi:MAG TPA: hypothetical protein DCS29_00410 [Candidatus Magasanikbacteria bacterium]|nr:MAG: hypothetical protein A2479_03635 [Candidatus Magasanikbacteria bacterium RIFOXYC2_FULL_39_8]HAT03227.1 hypothetical protein [Candidatus Magasanikbacteria bacterium]